MLTKDQHHTLLSSGFNLYTRLIKDAMKRADDQKRFDDVVKLEGEVVFNGRKCYKIVLEDPTFSYVTVTGKSRRKFVYLESAPVSTRVYCCGKKCIREEL
jgi:hypothetical protein